MKQKIFTVQIASIFYGQLTLTLLLCPKWQLKCPPKSDNIPEAMANDFMMVFTPKQQIYPNKRFLVSWRQLHNYIGQENANKAITAANALKQNKTTVKFRKYGKIEIYLK